ncbi:15459_t:CDS:1, partial [Acaulospora morrowiae]
DQNPQRVFEGLEPATLLGRIRTRNASWKDQNPQRFLEGSEPATLLRRIGTRKSAYA